MALVMTGFSFFWNAALPPFEANTLNHLGADTHRYSSIRLWGSIGFILTVAALGALFEQAGTGWLPVVLIGLFAAIWLASLLVPEKITAQQHHAHLSLREVLQQPVVISVLLVCFLVQASHGPYYTFYSIYMSEHGYSETLIGELWALGVVAEIGVFLKMRSWLPRYGARRLLLSATALTALRWLLLAGFVDNLWVMVLAQTLHAASFGLYHAVSIHLFHQLFRGRLQGRGQALYSSVSFGAGGAAGSFAAGYLWQGAGAGWMYLAAAGVAALALAIAWRGIRDVD
jgi:PPP family 3-phenylpropionic acid transporter